MIDRRALLLGLAAAGSASASTSTVAPPSPGPPPLALRGAPTQGGYLLVRSAGRAPVNLDGQSMGVASTSGWAVVGFDRDAPPSSALEVGPPSAFAARTLRIEPRNWSVQSINGLPPSTVAPTDPAVLARIRREAELKAAAFASRDDADHFTAGLRAPVQGRRSSSFGNQRILNGQPGRPHYGVDIAAPRGAPVVAPCAGLVVLAQPDMHFEGGLILIDHGQGLVGAFLHLSRLDVAEGQRVTLGQRIGAVGATGRATGPHLCWRLKWRDRNLDPSLWLQPARTL